MSYCSHHDYELEVEAREQYFERLRNSPLHLCRLRHFGPDRWSLAFYTYSQERYEPAFFGSGEATVRSCRWSP